MKTKKKINSDRVFGLVNGLLLAIVTLLIVYPLYFIIVASISDPVYVNSGQTMFFPKGITFDGYTKVFEFPQLLTGFKNSIIYTVVGTVINLLVCVPTAFALSRKELVGRRFLNAFFLVTMYFSGGLIPGYLLLKELHLLNKIWAIVLPGALSVYNMIICRSFFQSNASDELLESVKIDGGSYFTFFFKVILPVSKAIIAVMVLFHALAHWNKYLEIVYYIKDPSKYSLQVVIRNLSAYLETNISGGGLDAKTMSEMQKVEQITRFSVVIIASIPVFLMYPFIQKYFVKGVMIGSVKG
jgi:putative aldouronate transport system permease protein